MPGLAVATIVLLAACGQTGDAVGRRSSADEAIFVNLRDSGRTMSLNRGELLTVALDATPNAQWVLGTYPRRILKLLSPASRRESLEFEARARGRGTIVIVDFTRRSELLSCGDRRRSRLGSECPIAGGVDIDSLPSRSDIFRLDVVIK